MLVGGQEQAASLRRVEGGERVVAVAEVSRQAFGDYPTGRRDAYDVSAQVLGQLVEVDGQREREPEVVGRLALVEGERSAGGAPCVGDHVEADEVGLVLDLQDDLGSL